MQGTLPHTRTSPRHRSLALAALFLFALCIRTLKATQEVIANPDVMRFVDQMQNLIHDPLGTMRTEVYHPLQGAVGWLVHTLVSPCFADPRMGWIWALRIVGIVAGSLLAVQIARLARWLGAPFWAAWLAGAVWILGRRTGTYGSDGLSDMLTWSLFLESILLVMPALQHMMRTPSAGSPWRWTAAGILSGLAYLARPEGAAAWIILSATLVVLATCRRRGTGRRFKLLPRRPIHITTAFRAATLLTIGFFLIALPYMLTIGSFTHKKTLVTLADTPTMQIAHASQNCVCYQSRDRQGAVFAEDDTHRFGWDVPLLSAPDPTPLQGSMENFGGKFNAIFKVSMELEETFFWAPWLALLGAALLKPRLWGRPRLRTLVIIWILIWDAVMYWLLHRAGYLDGRHTLPLIILLHALLALALSAWTTPMARWMAHYRKNPARWNNLPAWRRSPHWPRTTGIIVALLVMLPGTLLLHERPRGDKDYQLAAAHWIRAHVRPDAVICDAQRLVGYYSGNPYDAWDDLSDPQALTLRQSHPQAPLLLGRLFAADKEPPTPVIGPYHEIARFESTTATRPEIYILYAHPNDPWQK